MKPAPLYVHSHDFVVWLLQRTTRFPRNQRFVLAARLNEAALDLLEAVSVALAHPEPRDAQLASADHALTRLRVGLRLTVDLDLLSQRQVDHAMTRIAEIGRMIGGWRRSRRTDAQ